MLTILNKLVWSVKINPNGWSSYEEHIHCKVNIPKFAKGTVPPNGLRLLGIRACTGTIMTQFRSRIYIYIYGNRIAEIWGCSRIIWFDTHKSFIIFWVLMGCLYIPLKNLNLEFTCLSHILSTNLCHDLCVKAFNYVQVFCNLSFLNHAYNGNDNVSGSH